MFDSVWLEVAIGLSILMVVISLVASSLVEIIGNATRKRSEDLWEAVDKLLEEPSAATPLESGAVEEGAGVGTPAADTPKLGLKDSTVLASVNKTSGRTWILRKPRRASYLSAKDFADGAVELLRKASRGTQSIDLAQLPAGLRERIEPIVEDVGADLVAIKAELEDWFDRAMDRLEGAYKRWAQLLLFCIGLAIAIAANISVPSVVLGIYNDPIVRETITAAADELIDDPEAAFPLDNVEDVAERVENLDQLGFPIGWDDWDANGGPVVTGVGWLVTAVLVMLGAPFWFDLLSRLVSLRSTGAKPPSNVSDPNSATAQRSRPVAVVPQGTPAATPALMGPADAAAGPGAEPAAPRSWQDDLDAALAARPTPRADSG